MKTKVKFTVTVKHDNGKINFSVWAESKEDAINRVCNAENCPKSAIIKVSIPKPTIYDIKRLSEDSAPYFFSRRTLQFFGQKVSDFKVYRTDQEGKFLIMAQSFGGNKTTRLFNIFTNELEHLPTN